MPDEEYFTPTLLVGVGGTGCAIAERIYLEARRNNTHQRERIGALVLDTNMGDLAKVRSVPEGSRVAFSTPDTVRVLLETNRDASDEWFFAESDRTIPLLNMTILEGAGQIRMITRLALHDRFGRGDLVERCRKAISGISQIDGAVAFNGRINILVVGSLAGATGSGSFYQVALVLRQICVEQGTLANIMGLFLMPDIFIRTGKIRGMEIDNVMANSYAALKELNAINVATRDPAAGFNLQYSFMPGRVLREGEAPFSSVTLIDYEASRGGNMGTNIDNYLDLATRAGYLLIFSPLGPSFGAVAVNQIQEEIARLFDGEHNLFAGLGVSTLNYPATSMRDHLAHKLVLAKMDANWIRLDELYRMRARRFAELKAAGQATEEPPKIEATYLRDLEELGVQQKVPFFRDIWNELHPVVVTNPDRPGEPRPIALTYVDAFMREAEEAFWRPEQAKRIKARQYLDADSLKTPSEILEAIRGGEGELNADLRTVDGALRDEPDTIYTNAVNSAEDLAESEWRDSHIQKWMIKDGPHPVRNRAFLYQVRRIIRDRLAALDTEALRKALFKLSSDHAKAWAENPAPDGGKEPTQRENYAIIDNAERIVGGGGGILSAISGRLGGNKSQELVASYVLYYRNSLDTIREYAVARLQKGVLERMLARVDGLIETYAGLFGEIELIGREIRDTIEREEKTYSGANRGTDGNVHVYADKECREAAWKRVELQTMAVGVASDVHRALDQALHEAHRVSVEKRTKVAFNELGALFREKVIKGFAQKTVDENYGSDWDITVIEAVRREAEVKGRADADAYLEEKIRLVSAQAEPYVRLTQDNSGQPLKFWALHPDARDSFTSVDLFDRLTGAAYGGQALVSSGFSRSQLFCVNFRLNLSLSQLSKLAEGDFGPTGIGTKDAGPYRRAYLERIEARIRAEMEGGDKNAPAQLLSPHTHRDWHRPGVLPEINPEAGRRIRAEAVKAAVISIHFGLLEPMIVDRRKVMRFSTLNRLRGVRSLKRDIAATHDLAQAVPEFLTMTDVVRTAGDFWSTCTATAVDVRKGQPDIIASLTDPARVVSILGIAADRTRQPPLDGLVVDMVESWCRILEEGVTAVYRDLGYRARQDKVEELTREVREALQPLLEEQFKPELRRHLLDNFDGAVGRALEEMQGG